jgi:hypothetical protein
MIFLELLTNKTSDSGENTTSAPTPAMNRQDIAEPFTFAQCGIRTHIKMKNEIRIRNKVARSATLLVRFWILNQPSKLYILQGSIYREKNIPLSRAGNISQCHWRK